MSDIDTVEPAPQTYRSRSTRRNRRSSAQMVAIEKAMLEILGEHKPQTVRQVFYQLVSRGVVDKTEREYKGTVIRVLSRMRRAGRLPFDWIADNTRWQRKPDSYSSLGDALEDMQRFYRRDVWREQADYVEVWCEKDALAGVIYDETAQWDVPLMVSRGYSSLSLLHGAAQTAAAKAKPCHIYYLGDYDPSGLDIARCIERDLRGFAKNAEICFHRVAVTPEQIQELHLPTRPTKKTDTRAKGFQGQSVELDAIPSDTLRGIVRRCILGHIDEGTYENTRRVERAEIETLETFRGAFRV